MGCPSGITGQVRAELIAASLLFPLLPLQFFQSVCVGGTVVHSHGRNGPLNNWVQTENGTSLKDDSEMKITAVVRGGLWCPGTQAVYQTHMSLAAQPWYVKEDT